MSYFYSYEEDINSIRHGLSNNISHIRMHWPDKKAEEFFEYFMEIDSSYSNKFMAVLKEYTDVESRIHSIIKSYYRDYENA